MGISENKFSEMKILGKGMNILKALDTNYLTQQLYQFILFITWYKLLSIYTIHYSLHLTLTKAMYYHFLNDGNLIFYFCFNLYLFLTSSYVYQTLVISSYFVICSYLLPIYPAWCLPRFKFKQVLISCSCVSLTKYSKNFLDFTLSISGVSLCCPVICKGHD